MSFLQGFLSLFDWMFPPKTYQELTEELDEKMQDLYDQNGWGQYQNPLQYAPFPVNNCSYISATDINRITTAEQYDQTIYTDKETLNQFISDTNKKPNNNVKLTKDQGFAIFWLYNRVAEKMPPNPIKGGGDEIVVDGVNITRTIKELLTDRLFI